MKLFLRLLIITGVLFLCPLLAAQDMVISDSDDNLMLQVNDEGNSGSITLPQSISAPADTTDKLYNVGGALFWKDAQLGTGWTRSGTNVHLINANDNVGIGVVDPDAKLEVNGQIKITGGSPGDGKLLTSNADGLASWTAFPGPRIATAASTTEYVITGNYLNNTYDNTLSVTITVPASGTIMVAANGYVSYKRNGEDILILGLLDSSEGDPNSSSYARNILKTYWMLDSDCNCPDTIDQYRGWSMQRGFTVSSAGSYTYRLWICKYPYDSNISVNKFRLTAEYFPN